MMQDHLGSPTLLSQSTKAAPHASAGPRQLPDPLMDSLIDHCQGGSPLEPLLSLLVLDPMLHEFQNTVAPPTDRALTSIQAYKPVSLDWVPLQEHSGHVPPSGSSSETRKAVEAGGLVSEAISYLGLVPSPEEGTIVQVQSSPVEEITTQVQSMDLQADIGPTQHTTQTESTEEGACPPPPLAQTTDGRRFLDQLFPTVLAPALRTPSHPQPKACNRSVSVEPSRRSLCQTASKSVMPVAHRATH
jgi:hypothetical protein